MSEIITQADVNKMLRLGDYSRLNNPTVIQAFGVLRELRAWVGQASGSMIPEPHIDISQSMLLLSIGDVAVWYSEENDLDELTFAFCKSEFAKHVADLQAVLTPDAE